MGKQRRFVVFAEGEGYTVRGVTALKRELKILGEGDYPTDDVLVYEGALGDAELLLVAVPEEV